MIDYVCLIFISFPDKDIVTPTVKADNVSPFVLLNQKPYQLPVRLRYGTEGLDEILVALCASLNLPGCK